MCEISEKKAAKINGGGPLIYLIYILTGFASYKCWRARKRIKIKTL